MKQAGCNNKKNHVRNLGGPH